MEITANTLSLRSVNDRYPSPSFPPLHYSKLNLLHSKTSFATSAFSRDIFFESYEFTDTTGEYIHGFLCKLPIKPIAAIFKNLKRVIQLTISLQDASHEQPEITFEFLLDNGIRKIHQFFYQDDVSLRVTFDENEISQLTAEPKIFSRLLEHIQHSHEVSIEINDNGFRLKSFHVAAPHASMDSAKNRYMT